MKLTFETSRARFAQSPTKRTRSSSAVTAVLIFITVALLALLLGAVIGLGSPSLLIILAGAIFGTIGFVLMDSYRMLLIVFVLAFVVQGSAASFLGNRQVSWVVIGLAVLFTLRAVLDRNFAKRTEPQYINRGAGAGVLVALLIYAISFFASTAFNRTGAMQFIVAFKSAWPILGVLLAFAWFRWSVERQTRLWQIMIWISLLQLPVVVYQHFFLAAMRSTASHDAVVGTFGGSMVGGGNSALMVLFTITVMSYSLVRWDRRLMSLRMMLLVCGVGLAVILLGEVKAAFVWMPIAFVFVLRRRILRNLLSFAWYVTVIAGVTVAIWTTYSALYWSAKIDNQQTISAKIEASGGYFFDPNQIDYASGEVGRAASLAIWADDKTATVATRLIGYGPGAIKSGPGLGTGALFTRFAPLHVDPIAFSTLLWDVGLIGTLGYVSMFGCLFWTGWRYLRNQGGTPEETSMVEAAVATMMLCTTLLIYNRTLMDDVGQQLLFAFAAGTILQASRFGKQKKPLARPLHPAVAPYQAFDPVV